MEKNCVQCGKLFEKPYTCGMPEWSGRKYCSKSCADEARKGTHSWNAGKKLHYQVWNAGKKTGLTPWNKGKGDYARELGFGKWMKGKVGEEANAWKGDDVGYTALHDWVKRYRGLPKQCEECGKRSSNPNMIHWANVSGEYKRDLTDWKRLCAKCHKAHDKGRKQRIFKTRKRNKGLGERF